MKKILTLTFIMALSSSNLVMANLTTSTGKKIITSFTKNVIKNSTDVFAMSNLRVMIGGIIGSSSIGEKITADHMNKLASILNADASVEFGDGGLSALANNVEKELKRAAITKNTKKFMVALTKYAEKKGVATTCSKCEIVGRASKGTTKEQEILDSKINAVIGNPKARSRFLAKYKRGLNFNKAVNTVMTQLKKLNGLVIGNKGLNNSKIIRDLVLPSREVTKAEQTLLAKSWIKMLNNIVASAKKTSDLTKTKLVSIYRSALKKLAKTDEQKDAVNSMIRNSCYE